MKVNINQSCSITLQKRGVEAYNKYYIDLGLEGEVGRYKVGDVVVMLLWEVMNVFGSACYIGLEPPFDTNIEIDGNDDLVTNVKPEKIQVLFEPGKRAFKL